MDRHDKVIEAFGQRVKTLRGEQGYSQEAFAQEAGIDRSYYGRIERSKANPTLRQIASIADLLGVSIAELFTETPKSMRRKK